MSEFREFQENYWEKQSKRRKPTHPAVEAFAKPKIDWFMKKIALPQQARVLDVGCGNGYFTHYFQQRFNTTGLDSSKTMLDQNPAQEKVLGSAEKLPFKENSFDLVFCSNLLHHLEDPVQALKEMKRVSRQYVVFSEPNSKNPLMYAFGLAVKAERKTLQYDKSFMESLAKKAGLKILHYAAMGTIPPNKTPKWMVSWLKPFDGESDHGMYHVLIASKQ